MDQKLKVIIEADAKPLQQELDNAQKSVRQFGTAFSGSSQGVFSPKFRKTVEDNAAALRGFAIARKSISEGVFEKSAQGVGRFTSATGRSAQTLVNFNRVIQDAPFGLLGVANNIDPLISSFQALQRETGSSGGAFRALGKSLLGPTGILFAFSAISSIALVYGDRILAAINKTDEFKKSLSEAVGSAQGEIETLRALVSIAKDETQTRERRLQAVEVLNQKYPQLNKNLTLEKINTDEVAKSIQRVTSAIEERAKIRAAEEFVAKKAGEFFEKQLKAEQDFINRRNLALQGASNVLGFDATNLENLTKEQLLQVRNLVGGAIGEARTAQRELLEESEKDYRQFVSNLNKILADTPNLIDALSSSNTKTENPIERFLKVDRNAVLANIFAVTSEAEKTLVGFSQRLSGSIGPDIFSKRFDAANERLKLSLTNVELTLIAFNERATQIVNQGTVNALSGLGQALGQALISGQNLAEALGASLLSSLGSVLTQLGELAIATGVGLLAVQTALSSLNPAIAIAAGIALVALGSAFSAGAQKLSGQFGGGSGGFSGPASNFSAQQSFTPSQSSFDFDREERDEVIFRVDGTTLVGVLNNASRQSRRNGGALRLT